MRKKREKQKAKEAKEHARDKAAQRKRREREAREAEAQEARARQREAERIATSETSLFIAVGRLKRVQLATIDDRTRELLFHMARLILNS